MKGADEWFLLIAAILISLLACHLLLNRWMAAAKLQPDNPVDYKDISWRNCWKGLKYTGQEIVKSMKCFPVYISGTFVCLFLIILTLIGVFVGFC